MKRSFTGIFVVLGMAFLLVTVHKYWPGEDSDKITAVTSIDNNKNRIVDFWNFYNKATDYRTAGEYQRALAYYRQASKLDSTHRNTLYYLGNMYLVTGQYQQSEQSFKRLLEVQPNSARSYTRLGNIYSCRQPGNHLYDLQKALLYFDQAFQLNREETGPLLQMAKIDIIQRRWTQAGDKLDDVIISNFRSSDAIFLKGYLEWRKGRHAEAENMLDTYFSLLAPSTVHANVGEGETERGSSAMLSDSLSCSLISNTITQFSGTNGQTPDMHRLYQSFTDSLNSF